MKVLLFNGSNREHGCTFTALSEAARILNEEGVETEILQIGAAPVADCIGCRVCAKTNRCVFQNDCVNERLRTDLFSARPFTLRIRAGAFCPCWTECFTRRAVASSTSPRR